MRAVYMAMPGQDFPTFGEIYDGRSPAAHNEQFLNPDPACKIQLRRFMPSDVPPQGRRNGATGMLIVRDDRLPAPLGFTVKADRTRIRNTRSGVMHAINCIAKTKPRLGMYLRGMAEKQTVWGEPG